MFVERSEDKKKYEALHGLLAASWSWESCSVSAQANWPGGNPAKGQCFPSALVVQDHFGGDVGELALPGGAIHYYNIIDGTIVDLTSEQFAEEVTASFYAAGTLSNRAKRLSDSAKRERYEILSAAVKIREAAE